MTSSSFWHWFTANEKTLRSFHTLSEIERNELLYCFSQNLKYYNPQIGYRLIITPEQGEPPSLVFSACGDRELHNLILDLMETVPRYPNWIIKASLTSLADEDPDYFEKEYCLNGLCCKPSNIKFWGQFINVSTQQFILGIIFDFQIDNKKFDLWRQIVGIILTDTLGELIYERYIEDFIIHSQIPEDEELFELYELKLYLEEL